MTLRGLKVAVTPAGRSVTSKETVRAEPLVRIVRIRERVVPP